MNNISATFLAAVWMVILAVVAPAHAGEHAASTPPSSAVPDGSHDFDFEFGEWRVRHRVLKSDGSWQEFAGTCSARALMAGAANVEDHKFDKPSGVTRGVALRAYDHKSAQWAIWWIDSRNPHGALDPPVVGRFEAGVGTFYSDGELNGKPTRTRFIWSQITATSARWEQAYSVDAGASWQTNWTMEFQRLPPQ